MSKYTVKSIKRRFRWFKNDIRRIYYRLLGVKIGYNHSCLPSFGKTKFCKVKMKGSIIEITDLESNRRIRIIPCLENHGIFIERLDKSQNINSRGVFYFDLLWRLDNLQSERRK